MAFPLLPPSLAMPTKAQQIAIQPHAKQLVSIQMLDGLLAGSAAA